VVDSGRILLLHRLSAVDAGQFNLLSHSFHLSLSTMKWYIQVKTYEKRIFFGAGTLAHPAAIVRETLNTEC
jgi:hypothetical protein